MDCVPVLSQVKSAALFIKGNKQRASETQKRFIGTVTNYFYLMLLSLAY